ncbi:uncharacterized protein METZ01_LOCUS221416 [marine metagenome]|uniref:Uncharacterized protein n=1 Tax=marine metagenome TaxID=408172 RepID=A0A382G105_9ZZZZ
MYEEECFETTVILSIIFCLVPSINDGRIVPNPFEFFPET